MSKSHIEAARQRGEARSAEIKAKVHEAMAAIQKEIASNNGVYPENGGLLSMNEVSRRAKISDTTLFSPKQKELGKSVKAWIEALKQPQVNERGISSRSVTERLNEWRKKYFALQDAHIASELELQDAMVQLEESEKARKDILLKYESLMEQMRKIDSNKIIAFPRRLS